MPKLLKGARKGNATPAKRQFTPIPKIRLKQKPRGKPFPKGNSQGLATRFIKGVCPNPLGRARSKEIGSALRTRCAQVDPLDVAKRTYAMELADEWIAAGLGGNTSAIDAIASRLEGKPATSINVSGGNGILDTFLAGVDEVYVTECGGTLEPPLLEEESSDEQTSE